MMSNGLPKKVQDKLDTARERAEDQKWTEQQERLLRAAQAVVNDASPDLDEEDGQMIVDQEVFADLKAIVQEISDDAVRTIRRLQQTDHEAAVDVANDPRGIPVTRDEH